ncbi:hypothetical protein JKP88DRAFT_283099 [Tribonema minus]|uniref:Uncharacterized protein n=1 Tax=Tribonema minus TaxID=303371 RepID=A0A836C7K6_9STRA|nr:hypothetical protein JKP88DRAFT_283099 [Tribonema minus]
MFEADLVAVCHDLNLGRGGHKAIITSHAFMSRATAGPLIRALRKQAVFMCKDPLLALAYAAADAEAAAAEAAAAGAAAAPDVDVLLQQLPRETVAALIQWLDMRDHAAYLARRAAASASGGGDSASAATKAEAEVTHDLSAEEAEFALSSMTDGGASTAGLDSVGGAPGTAEGDGTLEIEVGSGGVGAAPRSRRTAQLYADAVKSGMRTAAADPEVQVALSAALENTLFNLFQEALAGEFDLSSKPLRRANT